jgi:transposase
MPKSHPPYPSEFRQRLIELVRKGRTPEELSRQFEPSAQAIRGWVKQAALDAGERSDGLTSAERDELRRLRREVRQLREERVILSNGRARHRRCHLRREKLAVSYAGGRPGSRGRQLHGDIASPFSNMVRGRLAHLRVVTPSGDPV